MDNLAVGTLPPNAKNGQMVSYGDDRTAHVTFSDEIVRDEFIFENEGRSVYRNVIELTLQWPGNTSTIFKTQFSADQGNAGNEWTHRFPTQWQAYKRQMEHVPEGMPLVAWAAMTKQQVMAYKAQNVHTVEQVAALSDITGPSVDALGWRKMRDLAKAHISPEINTAEVSRLTRQNEDLQNKIESMQQQMADLMAMRSNENSASVTLQKRGRPPKQMEEENDRS